MNLLEKIQTTFFKKRNNKEEKIEKEASEEITVNDINGKTIKEENGDNQIEYHINKELIVQAISDEFIEKEINNDQIKETISEKKAKNYINIIKTKLYYDRVTAEDVESLKKAKIDEWRKTVALIAIYDKQKNKNACKKLIKEARDSFQKDTGKMKCLNKLHTSISSNKPQSFDWKIYYEMLKWEMDEEVKQKIEDEIKQEQLLEKEKIRKAKENKEKQILEAKLRAEESERIKREKIEKRELEQQLIKEIKFQEQQKNIQQNEIKKGINTKKISKNKKVKEIKMKDLFYDEIFMARVKACVEAGSDKTDFKEKKQCIKDIDNLEIFGDKTVNMRAKMQLIMYLRKYGMSSKAEERLPKEYEIYEGLENILLLKKVGEKFDDENKIKAIREKNDKIEGNDEFVYNLIEKILDKNEEVR